MTPWRQLPANVKLSTIRFRGKFRIAAEYFNLPEDVREAAWKSAMEDRPKAERIYEAIAKSLSYPSARECSFSRNISLTDETGA